jgi:alkylation response protein AidB-like acyl-CoA dehydrogenase
MGLETPAEYGGAECSFTAAVLAVEELAKIDPSISALCDIHVSSPVPFFVLLYSYL